LALAALCLAASGASHAGEVLARVQSSGVLRVCIWPLYAGISYRHPQTQALSGIDIDLSAELAKDLGARLQYVDSSFATLIADLQADRCDAAMFAVGRLPQRQEHLAFTRPYLASDIYGITTRNSPVVREWADIDKPGVMVGVQAGTFMEPVMKERLQHATLVVIKPPLVRERELQAGRIDVFMTDYPYSETLMASAAWAARVAPPRPFHVLPYGYASRKGDDEWARVLDDFVARIRKDGRLGAAAERHRLTPILVR
jgi:cyclohexadienyl dehydratase